MPVLLEWVQMGLSIGVHIVYLTLTLIKIWPQHYNAMWYLHSDVTLNSCFGVFFINSGFGADGVTSSCVDSVCPPSETQSCQPHC